MERETMSTDDPSSTPLSAEELAIFPVERWARIVASIDADPEAEADILAANDLDEGRWERIDGHWLDAQQRELEAGGTTLLVAGDEAYLARLEEERGPLTAATVGRLVVAGERGARDVALGEVDIPEDAAVVVERAWNRRCASDRNLAGATARAIEEARAAGREAGR